MELNTQGFLRGTREKIRDGGILLKEFGSVHDIAPLPVAEIVHHTLSGPLERKIEGGKTSKKKKKKKKKMKKKTRKKKKKKKKTRKKKKGSGKKRTVRKSKGNNNSDYFEFKSSSSNKFWSATKDGSKITTRWGIIGTDGSSTTKDYGSKVDEEYKKLIQSKKDKGYVGATESKKTLRKELDCKKFTRYHKGKGNRLQWPPVMMGIPAGKGQAYKYLGKYNQFTDEPVPVRKGLVAKRVKNPDDAWGQYCGSRRPASKSDVPVHPGSKKYFIHDNGGRPFLVYVAGNKVWIYKHSKETIVSDQKDFDNPKYYSELIKEYNAKQVFVGKSPLNDMTKYSGGHGPKFTGNSILLKIGDKRYVSIGWTIYEFSTKDQITEYYSPVGNSDVPYPVAVGTDYVYFMIEDVYVEKELFKDFPKKYKWHDHAYAKLWGQEPFIEEGKTWKQSNMKKHRHKMMNVKMVHKRTQ